MDSLKTNTPDKIGGMETKQIKPLPTQSVSAGSAFIVTGIVIACIGLFAIFLGLVNGGEMGPFMVGSSAVIFGLLLMIVGYVKQAAIAATESYLLQKRIYEEQQEVTSSSAE